MSKVTAFGSHYRAVGPGRVNLLGEHVDYNDGVVLPAAIDRQVTISAEMLPGDSITIQALDLAQEVSFSLANLEKKVDLTGHPLPGWALYPAGVAWVLQNHGLKVTGLRASFTSNIPIGSGLSSSAAVEVSFAALWNVLGGWEASNMKLAQLSQEAEVQYVGVNCGLMDQFASANGVEGHALYFDTRSLEWHPVPLPSHTAIVIADSTMRRSLTNSAYNERRAQCEEAVRLLQQPLPGIRSLRDVTPAQFHQYAAILPEVIRKRAQHIVEEIARVEEAVPCLQNGDAAHFGQLMFAGHASLRDLYEVSIPELDQLVEIAANLPGCWGARLTGAGFGGCTVNLVQEDAAGSFIEGLKQGYRRAAGKEAQVYLCHASRGASVE
jgi:galactokinase